MRTLVAVLALLVTGMALFLPTRRQAFTRVQVDGRAMRMLIAGSGNATVVFENGLGAPLETTVPAIDGQAAPGDPDNRVRRCARETSLSPGQRSDPRRRARAATRAAPNRSVYRQT